jgi:hypothetical protein
LPASTRCSRFCVRCAVGRCASSPLSRTVPISGTSWSTSVSPASSRKFPQLAGCRYGKAVGGCARGGCAAHSLGASSLLGCCGRSNCRFQRGQIAQNPCHTWTHAVEFPIRSKGKQAGSLLVYRSAKQHSEPVGKPHNKRGAKVDEITRTPLELIERIAALMLSVVIFTPKSINLFTVRGDGQSSDVCGGTNSHSFEDCLNCYFICVKTVCLRQLTQTNI